MLVARRCGISRVRGAKASSGWIQISAVELEWKSPEPACGFDMPDLQGSTLFRISADEALDDWHSASDSEGFGSHAQAGCGLVAFPLV